MWKAFAHCLYKLCVKDVNSPWLPDSFKSSRCETWLTKYFKTYFAESEFESGNLEVLTYKASIAAHLVGPKLDYVVRANDFLQRSDNTSLSLFL
ncbi:hypothetical protein ACJIZ3_020011 [Penstemon smallii]|uniref:Uncharacterized protein n=1 Tax=Penstemon smallii TaxID=265156 RepID=A0ABD3SHD8_9LAMI